MAISCFRVLAADADPDKNGVVNLVEYAMKTPPKVAGGRPGTVVHDGTGMLQLVLDVRDDDPALSAVGQSGASTGFTGFDCYQAPENQSRTQRRT